MRMMKLSLFAGAAMVALGLGSAKAELLIAVAGPMTGTYASFGEQMRRGAECYSLLLPRR